MPTRFSWWELPQSVTPIAPTPINPQAQQMGQAASAMNAAQNAINAERLRSLAATTQLGFNADDWKLPTGAEWAAQNPGWAKPVQMAPTLQQPIAPTEPQQGYVDANGVWQLPYTPPAVQPGLGNAEVPGFVKGLGQVGDVLGAPGRVLGRAIFGQGAAGYEPDAMQNTFRDIWNGKSPSWFAPPDQIHGQIERDAARDFRKAMDALQQGDVGTAANVAINQSAISQSGAALKQFAENPSLLTGAQALMGAAGAALPFMPKAIFPLANSAVQGEEALLGSLMQVVPDVAGPYGEALKSVATLGGLETTLQDIPGTMTRLQQSVDETRAGKRKAFELANSTAQHAQEMMGMFGADKSAKYRAKSGILDKPFTDDPAAWLSYQTRQIAFSGIDAQKRAIERIAAGEDPSVAMRGKAGPVTGGVVFEDEKAEWQTKVTEYLGSSEAVAYQKAIKGGNTIEQAQEIAAKARAEAEDFVSGYNFIPGSEKPLAEMVLQTVLSISPLDPVNKIHLGKVFGWDTLIPKARALGISEKLGRVYEASARNIEGDTMQEQLLSTLRGLSPDQMRGEIKARRTLGQIEPPAGVVQPKATTWQKIGADLYLRYLGAKEYLPQSRAHIQDGYARDIVHTLTKDARSGAEAVERLNRFVNDPASLTRLYGDVPISMKAEMARPVVREALAELSKLPSVKMPKVDMFDGNKPPTFRPMDFMVEAISHLKLASDRVNDVKPMSERPFHERLGSGMKMWLGEFMLRTPGYIIRNMLSDSVIMAQDGLYSFDTFEHLTSYLNRFGITSDLVTGQPMGEWKASRLTRVPVIGDIQNKLGEINDRLEIGRRVRAYTTAFRQFINANYKPQIGEGARQILGDDLGVVASQLEAAFRTGASEKEVREAYQRIITPRKPMDTFDVGTALHQLDVPTDSITPEMGGRVWGDLQNTTTEAGVDRVVDSYREQIIAESQQRVMELGDVVNPRASTDAIINQDAAEYGDMVRGVADHAIEKGLLTSEQAQADTRQLLETIVQYETAIRDARSVIGQTIAGIPEGTDPLRVHAVLTWAMNQEYSIRDLARQKQAELFRQTLALIDSVKGISRREGIGIRQAWDEYRRLNDGEQRARLTEIRQVHEWANGAIQRIGDWDALVRERPELATESSAADDLIQQAQDMIRQNGTEDFDAKLLGNRTKIDLARRDTYRQSQVILRYEPALATHVFDVMTTIERDVQTAASNTVARVRLELARKDYGEIDLAEYDRRVNAHWNAYFDYADTRYGRYGQAQLLWVQVRNSQVATALRGFGYNDEQIAEMFMKATDVEGVLAINAVLENRTRAEGDQTQPLPDDEGPFQGIEPLPAAATARWHGGSGAPVEQPSIDSWIAGNQRQDVTANTLLEGAQPVSAPASVGAQPMGDAGPATNKTWAVGSSPDKVFDFEWDIVERDDVQVSHTENGLVNPLYPDGVQNRERDSGQSLVQVNKIANSFIPAELVRDYHTLDRGAPVVGDEDLAVESGNGRMLALDQVEKNSPALYQQYRDLLEQTKAQYGLADKNVSAMKRPRLVRRRKTPLEDRAAFALDANQSAGLERTPYEIAKNDIAYISDSMVANLVIGDTVTVDASLRSEDNAPFVMSFLQNLPEQTRASLLTKDLKELNDNGLQRIKYALFARTYPGENGRKIARLFIESIDSGVKKMENAVFAALGASAKAEAMMARGERDPKLTLTNDLSTVINVILRLKANNTSVEDYLNQSTFAPELSASNTALLKYFTDNAGSQKKMAELLRVYARAVQDTPDPRVPDMFGMLPDIDKDALVIGAIAEVKRAAAEDAGGTVKEDIATPYNDRKAYKEGKAQLSLDIDTRPGTTQKDVESGRSLLAKLAASDAEQMEMALRRVKESKGYVSIPGDELASTHKVGIVTLASRLHDWFTVEGSAMLLGQTVNTARDAADLASVYRNPKYEVMHYIFTDAGGKVVGELGISARLPGVTQAHPFDNALFDRGKGQKLISDWLNERIKAYGATKFYMLHNHPSGDSTPSTADMNATAAFAKQFPEFAGHIVIDHNEYNVITAKPQEGLFGAVGGAGAHWYSEKEYHYTGERAEADPLRTDGAGLPEYRGGGIEDVFQMGKAIINEHKVKQPVILGFASDLTTNAIGYLDLGEKDDFSLQSVVNAKANRVRMLAQLRAWGRDNGSPTLMIVLPVPFDKYPGLRRLAELSIHGKFIYDVVDSEGVSLHQRYGVEGLEAVGADVELGTEPRGRLLFKDNQLGMFTGDDGEQLDLLNVEPVKKDVAPLESPVIDTLPTGVVDAAGDTQLGFGALNADGVADVQVAATNVKPLSKEAYTAAMNAARTMAADTTGKDARAYSNMVLVTRVNNTVNNKEFYLPDGSIGNLDQMLTEWAKQVGVDKFVKPGAAAERAANAAEPALTGDALTGLRTVVLKELYVSGGYSDGADKAFDNFRALVKVGDSTWRLPDGSVTNDETKMIVDWTKASRADYVAKVKEFGVVKDDKYQRAAVDIFNEIERARSTGIPLSKSRVLAIAELPRGRYLNPGDTASTSKRIALEEWDDAWLRFRGWVADPVKNRKWLSAIDELHAKDADGTATQFTTTTTRLTPTENGYVGTPVEDTPKPAAFDPASLTTDRGAVIPNKPAAAQPKPDAAQALEAMRADVFARFDEVKANPELAKYLGDAIMQNTARAMGKPSLPDGTPSDDRIEILKAWMAENGKRLAAAKPAVSQHDEILGKMRDAFNKEGKLTAKAAGTILSEYPGNDFITPSGARTDSLMYVRDQWMQEINANNDAPNQATGDGLPDAIKPEEITWDVRVKAGDVTGTIESWNDDKSKILIRHDIGKQRMWHNTPYVQKEGTKADAVAAVVRQIKDVGESATLSPMQQAQAAFIARASMKIEPGSTSMSDEYSNQLSAATDKLRSALRVDATHWRTPVEHKYANNFGSAYHQWLQWYGALKMQEARATNAKAAEETANAPVSKPMQLPQLQNDYDRVSPDEMAGGESVLVKRDRGSHLDLTAATFVKRQVNARGEPYAMVHYGNPEKLVGVDFINLYVPKAATAPEQPAQPEPIQPLDSPDFEEAKRRVLAISQKKQTMGATYRDVLQSVVMADGMFVMPDGMLTKTQANAWNEWQRWINDQKKETKPLVDVSKADADTGAKTVKQPPAVMGELRDWIKETDVDAKPKPVETVEQPATPLQSGEDRRPSRILSDTKNVKAGDTFYWGGKPVTIVKKEQYGYLRIRESNGKETSVHKDRLEIVAPDVELPDKATAPKATEDAGQLGFGALMGILDQVKAGDMTPEQARGAIDKVDARMTAKLNPAAGDVKQYTTPDGQTVHYSKIIVTGQGKLYRVHLFGQGENGGVKDLYVFPIMDKQSAARLQTELASGLLTKGAQNVTRPTATEPTGSKPAGKPAGSAVGQRPAAKPSAGDAGLDTGWFGGYVPPVETAGTAAASTAAESQPATLEGGGTRTVEGSRPGQIQAAGATGGLGKAGAGSNRGTRKRPIRGTLPGMGLFDGAGTGTGDVAVEGRAGSGIGEGQGGDTEVRGSAAGLHDGERDGRGLGDRPADGQDDTGSGGRGLDLLDAESAPIKLIQDADAIRANPDVSPDTKITDPWNSLAPDEQEKFRTWLTASTHPIATRSMSEAEKYFILQRIFAGEINEQPRAERQLAGIDYLITDADELAAGGLKKKFRRNVDAIRILKQVEAENRLATPEEQSVLVKYVGWGGLVPAVDMNRWDPEWRDERDELRELLTDEELQSAQRSVLNAHYTSPEYVRMSWEIARKLGFTGGRWGEPGAGIGHYAGLMPTDMKANSRVLMVEKDSLSGRIIKQLYQNADTYVMPYEETRIPTGWLDAEFSNVPFGNTSVFDDSFRGMDSIVRHSLHDYYFAKALQHVRPGGIIGFITSRYTMDKVSTGIRQWLADRAEFIGAIRLPNDAFKKNANTSVTTDMIFLRRRMPGEKPSANEAQWVQTVDWTDANGKTFHVNEYYKTHPDNMFGRMEEIEHGGTVAAPQPNLLPDGRDINELIANAPNLFPADVYKPREVREADEARAVEAMRDYQRQDRAFEGQHVLVGGELAVISGGMPVKTTYAFDKQVMMTRGVKLVEVLKQTIKAQLDNDEDAITASRAALNDVYDDFVKHHGQVTSRAVINAFADDPMLPRLISLERVDKETKMVEKADIFTKKVIGKAVIIEKSSDPMDALFASLHTYGKPHLGYMSQILDMPRNEVLARLDAQLYHNPNGDWETADEYLSGNVKEKLEQARVAARSAPEYERNVRALEEVQPPLLTQYEISARLGAPWMPPDVIASFMTRLTGGEFTVTHNDEGWKIITERVGYQSREKQWNTPDYDVRDLVDDCLNQRTSRVYRWEVDAEGKKHRVEDKEASKLARTAQREIQNEFINNWLWSDTQRAMRLTDLYNTNYNVFVQRKFDGSHIKFEGLNPTLNPYTHQRSFVYRASSGANVYAAHEVGGGKTLEMQAAAIELRRLGIRHKPLHVVPKATLAQYGEQFRTYYPGANVLVMTKKDMEKGNRQAFMSKIATGDYDSIVVSHSAFGLLPVSPETNRRFINAQIAELEAFMKQYDEKSRDFKRLQKKIEKLETKLKELLSAAKDNAIYFEDLGVDSIMVDEAHLYKNLWFNSNMSNVKGLGSRSGNKKTTDMYMKTQWVQERNGGGGIIFASGTPISNSLVENFTIMRYLQPKLLKELGIDTFDEWVGQFGEVVEEHEKVATGIKMVTRLKKFRNMVELRYLQSPVMDIKTQDSMHLPKPQIEGGEPQAAVVPKSKELRKILKGLIARAEELEKNPAKPEKGADNILVINTDAKKAALDVRAFDPSLPDLPDSKLNKAVELALQWYKESNEYKGTILLFCDFSKPLKLGGGGKWGMDGFSAYDDIIAKLIKGGIPEKEIASIYDWDTDAKKVKLNEMVNAGKIRIVLGSTGKLGTGVNMQERGYGMMHLDVPYKPSELTQRNGRFHRPGNLHFEWGKPIKIVNLVTKGSFDQVMWQMIATKGSYTSDFMSEREISREGQDESAIYLNARQMEAASTDDPTIMRQMVLESKIGEYKLGKNAYYQKLRAYAKELQEANNKVRFATSDVADLKAAYENAQAKPDQFDLQVGGFMLTPVGKDGKITAESRRAANQKLGDLLKLLTDKEGLGKDTANATDARVVGGQKVGIYTSRPIGEYNGYSLVLTQLSIDNARPTTVEIRSPNMMVLAKVELPLIEEKAQLELGDKAEDAGKSKIPDYMQRFANAFNPLREGKLIPNAERELADQTALVAEISKQMDKPYEHDQEIIDMTAELYELRKNFKIQDDDEEVLDANADGDIKTSDDQEAEDNAALDAATSEDDDLGSPVMESKKLPYTPENPVPDAPIDLADSVVPAAQPEETINPMGEQNPAAGWMPDAQVAPPVRVPDGGGLELQRPAEPTPYEMPSDVGDRQTPESVVAQDAHVEANGDSDPFNVRTFIDHVTQQQLKALDAIRKGAKQHLRESAKATAGGKKLTDAQIKVLEEELQKNLRHLHETVEAGKTYANERSNFALLDYGKKRGFDTWTQLIAPFSYWGTRQGKNFLLRFLSDPSMLVAYWRYLEAMKKHNRNRHTRKRFENALKIPLSGLTGGKLDDIYIDPMQAIFPFDGVFGADDTDQNSTQLQQIYKAASNIGFRPSPFIDIPLRLSGAMMSKQPNQEGYGEESATYGPGSLGKVIPQSNFIQGATAALGMGNGMGINPEAPIRKALGIAETEAFDAYRVARSISNLAAERNSQGNQQVFERRPYLLAQEFIQKHAKDYPTALTTMKPADVAAELGVSIELATAAMQIAQEGAKMAAQERGLSQLGSFLGGQRLIQHPQGEYDRLRMSAQEKGAAYNPVTGQGSRAQVQAVQAANPALEVQRAQYGTIPGDDYDYRWLNDRAMTQEINAKFDQLKDQVIVMRPWDRKAGYAIEDARRNALERVDRTAAGSSTATWQDDLAAAQSAVSGANGVSQTVQAAQPLANYKPWSVAGATPQEALIVRQNEIMSQVSRTQPRTESYINSQGEIDYGAYREAVDDWRKNLPKIAKALPAMSIIMDKAKGEGNDATLTKFVSTMTGEQIDQYRWRNDTPLEAVQRTYYEAVYNPVMDAYTNLRNQGDSEAWDKTIGAVPAMDGNTLAQLTNNQYKGRFTPEQLAEVQKMQMPPLADVMKLTQGPQARAKTQARDSFWKVYNEGIPPGSEAYELKQNPLVSLILDRDSRGTATTEQYEMATASMNQYVQQNYGGIQPEWAQARSEKALLDQLLVAQFGQDGPALMQSYDMAANAERQATLRAQYPALNTILTLRYRYEQGHPVYAAYYSRKLLKGEQQQLGIAAPAAPSTTSRTNPLGVLPVRSVGR